MNGQLSPKKKHEAMDFERCFIMLCNWQTEQECLDRNLFGDKAKRLEDLDEIKPGDTRERRKAVNIGRQNQILTKPVLIRREMSIYP